MLGQSNGRGTAEASNSLPLILPSPSGRGFPALSESAGELQS